MKDAKSMYRGGDIVEAKHCDFDSSRLLGLVCPFCNEAVYLRAGTSRIGKNKMVLVNPAFCHYPGSAEDLDCERRSISGEGREEIERIKAEKRGQRLELYNKHLWDMIRTKYNSKLFQENSTIGINLMPKLDRDMLYLSIRGEWKKHASEEAILKVFQSCFHVFCEMSHFAKELRRAYPESSTAEDEKIRATFKYLCRADNNYSFHRSVCMEIVEFLRVKTSGFAFRNIANLALSDLICGYPELFEVASIPETMNGMMSCMMGTIIQTPWEAQIDRFSNPDRKAADEKYFALLESASKAVNKDI